MYIYVRVCVCVWVCVCVKERLDELRFDDVAHPRVAQVSTTTTTTTTPALPFS